MAKKPEAARGKATRIGKIKKIIKGIKEKPKTVGLNMSPGALGGRTKRRVPPPIARPDRSPPNQRSFGDDLENIRGRADKIAETIMGTFPMVGTALNRARRIKPAGRLNTDDLERASKKRGGKMSTGGEVDIDMTTETDV